MNIKRYAIDFALMFAIVLVVNLIVTYLYSLIFHGLGVINWETAFEFAITLGIVLPWVRHYEKKQINK